jgi:hypothetical protein
MKRGVLLVVAGLVGLLCAAAIGYAAYAVSRDSVAVPVTQLQPKPTSLAPKQERRQQPRQVVTTTTTDDHGGGTDHSGHGGGGGGDD